MLDKPSRKKWNGELKSSDFAGLNSLSFAPWAAFLDYSIDCWQRNVLLLDAFRQRGNQYLDHASKETPHVLHFDYELIMDGRDLERPVNYGLVKINPPAGIEIDETKRPFVVVDPRAGHGPGIGGFKPDSEIGAILKAGHPCYFIGFLPEPVPGQTLEEVGMAEIAFLEKVAERHASAEGRPCVIGNCQAGWAIMMLAAVRPDVVGPILVAGAPLSYWAGVRGQNPMRYLGGLLGGTWLTTLTGDMGNGVFDGAHLVSNFEQLNPANTLWSKNYNLWSKIDTEASRFLDFEEWWGGHVLLGANEMQSIADELFVGNKLVQGEIKTQDGTVVDLRNIKSPIIVFCSHGDNITPPQQALRWVLDLYDDIDDIRACGQTIIYAVHETIGHLGIFVSGSVGKKEHDQFTHNMDMIDVLPPGLYEAVFTEKTAQDANAHLAYGDYIVTFETRTLDDIRAIGDQEENDDIAFETVARVSEVNKSLYRALVSPWVRQLSTDASAEFLRQMHPARLQYSLFSDKNPFMNWVGSAAENVRNARRPVEGDNPLKSIEKQTSNSIVSMLDSYRDARDRAIEDWFFKFYGSPLLQALVGIEPGREFEVLKKLGNSPDHAALVQNKIRSLKERLTEGAESEAAIRSMLYIGLPDGRADERGFEVLKQIIGTLPPEKRVSLSELKALIREQFFMLLIDEDAAISALRELLPQDASARQKLLKSIIAVTSSSGQPSATKKARMKVIQDAFEIKELDAPPKKVPATAKHVSTAKRPSRRTAAKTA